MKPILKTYLSGSLSQHSMNPSQNYWIKEDEAKLAAMFEKKKLKLEILNPNDAAFQTRSDLFEFELDYITQCDFVLVELSERRGIGVGIEIYHAFQKNIPVYAVLPEIGYYKNKETGYVHPFLLNIVSQAFVGKRELFTFLETKSF